ncbi:MAG TPA: hypothetical protein VMU89_06585 [Thermomicrobiaceae bacterium]|nr:hypothetical protein [Thermomicrobiaceae bacterium]
MAEEINQTTAAVSPDVSIPEDRPIREEQPVRVRRPPIEDRPIQESTIPVYVEPPVVDAARAIDRLRWGPVVGGVLATLAGLIVLNVLGLAVGLSVFTTTSPSLHDLQTAAGVWGAISALIVFFVGGWLAGRTAAPGVSVRGGFPGTINGAMVWATALLALVVLGSVGIGGALGYFGASLHALAAAARGNATGSSLQTATIDAWGTFIALVLTLVVAAVGGWVGYVTQPARRAVD